MIVHPSHVSIVNEVYSPTEQEIAHYKGMIETFENALKAGAGAVLYEGEHIDYAHVNTAKQMLLFAEKLQKNRHIMECRREMSYKLVGEFSSICILLLYKEWQVKPIELLNKE